MSDMEMDDRARRTDGTKAAPRLLRKARGVSSLTKKVYDLLRADILTCTLPPGTQVSEAELAERFNISKTPVREALGALRIEGFVNTYPRRGYQIVPITFGDMQELFEVRTIVEAGAAELAAKRITPEEIAELHGLADAVYQTGEQATLKHFVDSNRQFHGAIAKATRNEKLYDLVLRQIDALERFFYLGAQLRDVNDETRSDHHAIVDALASGDSNRARDLIVKHNDDTREGLLQALARTRTTSPIQL